MFIRPLLALSSDEMAHFPAAFGVAPSSYLPFSKILTKEFSLGGSGERYARIGPDVLSV
jgi:hypothetical protein